MAEVYVYDKDGTNLESAGLCGALFPTECKFTEIANGLSSIEMTHPIDPNGKYKYLDEQCILKCPVPTKVIPSINSSGAYYTIEYRATVKKGLEKYKRAIYRSKNKSIDSTYYEKSGKKTVGTYKWDNDDKIKAYIYYCDARTVKEEVTYTKRGKTLKKWVTKKIPKVTGYIYDNANSSETATVFIDEDLSSDATAEFIYHINAICYDSEPYSDNASIIPVDGYVYADSIQWVGTDKAASGTKVSSTADKYDKNKSWILKDQYFRIVSVERGLDSVKVSAQHIFYDMSYNMSTFDTKYARTLHYVLSSNTGILKPDNVIFPNDIENFRGVTNIATTPKLAGHHYADKDIVSVLLDPSDGLATRYHAQLVRDNYKFALLYQAGKNRGTVIEYGKNTTGITNRVDYTNLSTAIRPYGFDEEGNKLYLKKSYIYNNDLNTPTEYSKGVVGLVYNAAALTKDLPFQRVTSYEGDDCQIDPDNEVDEDAVIDKLLDQCKDEFESGDYDLSTSIDIDLQLLSDTLQFEQYDGFESLYLFDTVTVKDKIHDRTDTATVSQIEWDVLAERVTALKIGAIEGLTPYIASWQITNISTTKLTKGSVTNSKIADNAVTSSKIKNGSITASKLNVPTQQITSSNGTKYNVYVPK